MILVAILMGITPCLAADQASSPKDLIYITEQYPPYNYQEDGKPLQGISVDLLEMVWERMGVDLNRSVIILLPWPEGYHRALNETNTVYFSLSRVPQREQLFKWAGPIGPVKSVLLVRSDRNINITTQEDLKKYKIGVINDTSSMLLLLDMGVKKEDLVLAQTAKPLIEMLENGSIDAWARGDRAGMWEINELGRNASDYKTAYTLGQSDHYYAFNKETPDSLVQSFQEAIDYLKGNKDTNGVSDYEKILSRYESPML
ncbi:Bacterial extracellular solute-binding proteins, family 3 [uncultured archaeon]|nr:Bacterial extracellular solute-binding proteins, family 3 [uncultured archaeon]